MRTHVYRNVLILPAARGGWYVQARHSLTGIPYSEECCYHARTLREAREYIRERLSE